MNRINEFFEPGTYADRNGHLYVAYDVVNHQYNVEKGLTEVLSDPQVIARDLEPPPKEYRRYTFPLSKFKLNFRKQ